MLTPTMAWLGTLVAGLIVGLVVRALVGARTRSPWLAAAVVGLIGAAAGRVLLNFSFFVWHPHFSGGVLGAVILSCIWLAATRARPASQ